MMDDFFVKKTFTRTNFRDKIILVLPMNKIYACIDLKSFYASVECIERNLDPMTTNLVVADKERTEKTICLAVTPSLKSYGISGRARLFEVIKKVREINYKRKKRIKTFTGKSYNDIELKKNKFLELDYITAPPQMKLYMKYSTDIFKIYLKHVSEEDIFVYSIDEVFIDITNYLKASKMNAREFITNIIHDVYDNTGITATAGIGTNLYLCKIAMDIVAKHADADEKGVRIATLNEKMYREKLWGHRPITDFWRVGNGIAKRLESINIYTMGDIALTAVKNEEILYKLLGINAELLIDHAFGYEPCTMQNIKSYKPKTNSLSSGQVLHSPYNFEKAKLIVREMIDLLVLDLVAKRLVTNQIVLTVGYDIKNISNNYSGLVITDHYGRKVPKAAHGTINLEGKTSSTKIITGAVMKLFNQIVNKDLLIRRVYIFANNLIREEEIKNQKIYKQLSLFNNEEKSKMYDKKDQEKEKKLQYTMLDIKKKFGKNAILKAMNLKEGGTTIERNNQVGGHRG